MNHITEKFYKWSRVEYVSYFIFKYGCLDGMYFKWIMQIPVNDVQWHKEKHVMSGWSSNIFPTHIMFWECDFIVGEAWEN